MLILIPKHFLYQAKLISMIQLVHTDNNFLHIIPYPISILQHEPKSDTNLHGFGCLISIHEYFLTCNKKLNLQIVKHVKFKNNRNIIHIFSR